MGVLENMLNSNTTIVAGEDTICPGCGGQGSWSNPCCSGAHGCSCGGDFVNMGTCNVCKGTGRILAGTSFDPSANLRAVVSRARSGYLGSGPTEGGF